MADEMNSAKIAELKEAFDMFDRDKNGLINYKELGNILRSQGHYMSDFELKNMIKVTDGNMDNLISFEEFINLMQSRLKSCDISSELLEAFSYFDKGRTGKISKNELRHIMSTLGEKIEECEIESMLCVAEADENGDIDYRKFVEKITA